MHRFDQVIIRANSPFLLACQLLQQDLMGQEDPK